MKASTADWFPQTLTALMERRDLDDEPMQRLMREVMEGRCSEAETAALLVALRMKGETALELAAAASVLREYMVRLETGRDDLLDTCGTGGDGTGTFNISTAAALVAAGAGVPVVKHGNRAVSSRSGSADVLEQLGVTLDGSQERLRQGLDRAGLAFCFAPHFHPAMARVAGVRRQLRVRTLFNCLGPLANPAGAPYQLLGVGRPELLDPLAGALARLGTRQAFLVCGQDGLDEVSLAAPTQVRQVRRGTVAAHEWTARDFGLEACSLDDLRAESPQASAAIIRAVLDGQETAARRVVLANAAAALVAAEHAATLGDGVRLAAEAIDRGQAKRVLEQLIRCSAGVSP